jgi:ActR/RegA family two-component response regulator
VTTPRDIAVDDDLPVRPNVLLVDDDEVNLLLTTIALRERGFAVTEATGCGRCPASSRCRC